MIQPDDVLAFWLDECSPSDWYVAREELDAEIRARFLKAWHDAAAGGYGMWLSYPSGALAYIILLDQFARNMFRDDGRSFQLDPLARAAAKSAISKSWDLKIDPPARQFFYLPLMHSEILSDQDRCIRLFKDRMPERGGSNLLHARVHREVIRRYGRFPYRNAVLQRRDTGPEKSFLEEGGYGAIFAEMSQSLVA